MKNTHTTSHLKLLATLIAAATLSAACSSTAIKLSESAANTNPERSPAMTSESPAAASTTLIKSIPESGIDITVVDAQANTITLNTDDADDIAPADASRPARLSFNFDFNKDKLNPDHQLIVEEHGRFLAEHPEIRLVINGHADAQGDLRYNQALSLKRAEHVADLLMSQGAMKEQIEIFSWGSTAPLADAQKNRDQRRVELKYTDEYWVQSTVE